VTDEGSGPTSPTVSAPADTSHVGPAKVTLTGTDNAGNATSVACPYTVLPLTFNPLPALDSRVSAHRTTSAHRTGTSRSKRAGVYDTVERLTVTHVPANASVTVVCSGKGCPFRVATCRLTRCKRTAGGTVNLGARFKDRRLAIGARVTVTVTSANTIGRAWVLTARGEKPPADRVACLAPGSQTRDESC